MKRLEWPLLLLGWALTAVLTVACGTVTKQSSYQEHQEVTKAWAESKVTETTSVTTDTSKRTVRRRVTTTITEPTPLGPKVTKIEADTEAKQDNDHRADATGKDLRSATGNLQAKSDIKASQKVTRIPRWPWWVAGAVIVLALAIYLIRRFRWMRWPW